MPHLLFLYESVYFNVQFSFCKKNFSLFSIFVYNVSKIIIPTLARILQMQAGRDVRGSSVNFKCIYCIFPWSNHGGIIGYLHSLSFCLHIQVNTRKGVKNKQILNIYLGYYYELQECNSNGSVLSYKRIKYLTSL